MSNRPLASEVERSELVRADAEIVFPALPEPPDRCGHDVTQEHRTATLEIELDVQPPQRLVGWEPPVELQAADEARLVRLVPAVQPP